MGTMGVSQTPFIRSGKFLSIVCDHEKGVGGILSNVLVLQDVRKGEIETEV